MVDTVSTPMNVVSRKDLIILLRNNLMNDSVEYVSDCDKSAMETNSPKRQPLATIEHINKKLFHSPIPQDTPKEVGQIHRSASERIKKSRKRKQSLIPNSDEKIKRAYLEELERDVYRPDACEQMRKKTLISLFHKKEYSMDVGEM